MEIQKQVKPSFSVIGRQGSTQEGDGFIGKLWQEANENFSQVAPLAKKDSSGVFSGFWGAMSDLSGNFQPWEDNFSKGLYLAGVEAEEDAQAPEGWTKWTLPASEYLVVKNQGNDTFIKMIAYLQEQNLSLAGAVYDFNDPQTGQGYQYFPIRRL